MDRLGARIHAMSKPADRRYESAYDLESNLRVVRFVGRFDFSWLAETAPYHPTHNISRTV